ncbi:gfo/Idh/MocA family oxidoreductase [Candidatus Poribacteria bacterium]|nr:gfo/Idh/MocA family oxidoreductase [Candidatus Poribacteria bacterium]
MDKLGVGVVGPGWAGGEHIKAYMNNPNAEVIGICGRDKDRTRTRMEEIGIKCDVYTDYEKMLKNDDIHVVSICTPNDLHVSQAIMTAEAGKHFLLEKPIALNIEELKKLKDVADKSDVKTVVGFVLRWNPLFETLKPLIDDDAIGNIFFGEVDYFHGIGPWYKQYEWNVKKSIGGSTLLSAGCHAVDGLRWFIGQEAVEVTAYSVHGNKNEFKEYEYDPTMVVIIKFDGGAIGKVASSIECIQPYVFNINLVGEKGTIKNNKLYSHKMPGQTDFATIPTILPDSGDVTHHPYQGEIDHLIDCILNDKESFVNIDNAIETHEICLAAEISAAEGKSVSLPLIC